MLNTVECNIYRGSKFAKEIALKKILEASNLHESMLKKASEYKKLEELAFLDKINVIKENVSYTRLEYALDEARKWLLMLNDKKVNKRRKYKERDFFNFLVSTLEKDVLGKKIKVKKITSIGYESYAYEILFSFENKNFALNIPIKKKISSKNWEYVNDLKLVLFKCPEEHIFEELIASYEEQEIKEFFCNFVS